VRAVGQHLSSVSKHVLNMWCMVHAVPRFTNGTFRLPAQRPLYSFVTNVEYGMDNKE